jgi:hypothetical protein
MDTENYLDGLHRLLKQAATLARLDPRHWAVVLEFARLIAEYQHRERPA